MASADFLITEETHARVRACAALFTVEYFC